jgi:zinc protease
MDNVTAVRAGRGAARRRARAALEAGEDAGARATYQGPVPYGSSMAIERYRLDNGLQLLLLVDRSAPVVSYHTWFRVGSRHEHDGKTGMAHLLEHLMFGEFEGMPHGTFDRKLEQAGAETNAATWVDWTYYHEQAPADQLGLIIGLEATRMGKLMLADDRVASELEVVANERRYRVEDDVDGAVSEKLFARAYTVHGYRTPTIGWMQDIRGLTRADCQAFYATYYAPNNATIVVVGDFDEIGTVRRIARHYGYLRPAEIPVEDARPEPPQTEERREVLSKPTETDRVSIGYHAAAVGDHDHPALSVLVDVLFGGRASRVHRSLVRDLEIATDVRAWVGSFVEPGLVEMQLVARRGHGAAEVLEALERELDRVCAEPIEEQELERAKARAELGLVRGLETCGGKAEQIGFFHTVLGDPAGAFVRLELLRAVSRSDVLRVARRYLRRVSRTVIEVHPQRHDAEVAA